jgi:single-stranded-DNA-specific exonuclease
LVHQGLKFLRASEWAGFQALKQVCKIEPHGEVTIRDVGFKIAPRLNAAGRLGSAQPALDILLTESAQQASRLAEELDLLNKTRYDTQAVLVEEALEILEQEIKSDALTVVLAHEGWPKGLLGLAASRVAEKSGRPTIMLTLEDDLAIGSGRTIGGFNLFEALSKVRDHCLSMGGHAQAAGLKVARDQLERFKVAFEQAAIAQNWRRGQEDLQVDLIVDLKDLELLRPCLASLEPYGQGHPTPVLVLFNINVLQALNSKSSRLDLRLSDGLNRLNVSAFNMSHRLEEVGPIMDVAITYDPESSQFGNYWRLVDFRPPKEPPQESPQEPLQGPH